MSKKSKVENEEIKDEKILAEETSEENAAKASEEAADEATQDSADNQETEAAHEASASDSENDKKDKKDLKIEELTDQYKRTLAEFDNYRRRTDKEKTAMFEVGAKSIIEKILPVVDNFERGLATVSEEEKNTPFCEGMDKIYKQLLKQLEDAGVKEIEALDKEFDPNFHNAVMHCEDENAGENIIVEVFQKGYTYKDSVVRHSMVRVAN